MADILKWLHDFIRDKGTKWFTKLAYGLAVLFALYLIDDYFGWSYYSKTANQVSLIKEINECLSDSTHSIGERAFLEQKKMEIIHRETIPIRLLAYFKSLFVTGDVKKELTVPVKRERNSFLENMKHELLHGTTIVRPYRFFLLNFIMIVLLAYNLFRAWRRTTDAGKKLEYVSAFLFTSAIVSLLYYWLVGLIPIISKSNIWINYLLYFILGLFNFYYVWKAEKQGSIYS